MRSGYVWSIAARYLRPRWGEAFIFFVAGFSILGITLGVATLITVMSVMNGFRAELFDRVLGVNGHAVIRGYDGILENYEDFAKQARELPGVTKATPLLDRQVIASRQGLNRGILLRGIEREDLLRDGELNANLLAGSFDNFEGRVVALGSQLAIALSAQVGDDITIISPQGASTPFGTAPRMVSYKVGAIFELGVYQYDEIFTFMPLAEAQTFFRTGQAVSGIEIQVTDPDRVEEIMDPMRGPVRRYGVITDWKDLNPALFSALTVERNVMFIILSLIIIVAAFNIISSLYMLVRAKAHDIAILRTMGAPRRAMMRIFIVAGGLIGVLGTFFGALLGISLTVNLNAIQESLSNLLGVDLWPAEVRFLSEMPSQIDWGEVSAVIIVSLLISIFATLYPAWRASKTDPVKVLRYE
jgi:lipoprotein-releasing system permease protein